MKVEVSGYDEALLQSSSYPSNPSSNPSKGKHRSSLKGVGERQIKHVHTTKLKCQIQFGLVLTTTISSSRTIGTTKFSDINSHITRLSALYSFHSSTLIFLLTHHTTPHHCSSHPPLFVCPLDRSIPSFHQAS